MKLSIIVPSIRPWNIPTLYNSICDDYKDDWEMIAIGPDMFPFCFKKRNFIQIRSWRSPNACQMEGLMEATGEYIAQASDDGIFLPDALDYAISMAEERTIVVGKYLEGNNPNPDMLKEDYYKFKYHKAYRIKGVPQDGLIFNCGIISRKLILELGGWDAEHFQTTTVGHADLGIRAYNSGIEMILMDKPMFKCSHQPGKTGDHAPIHNAMKKDLQTFADLYAHTKNPSSRTTIKLDNWKNTEEVWSRRFKK